MDEDRKNAGPGLLRTLLVGAFVLASGVQAIRTAAVSAASETFGLAASAWPDHPKMLTLALLNQVGQSAAAGRSLDPSAVALLTGIAKANPLSAEAFLVKAALEEKAGRFGRSEGLLVEARRRDPRAAAARLLLAQAFLRRGDTLAALEEMTVLSRLVPGSFAPLTSTLAAYARSPSAVRDLKQLLGRRPDLEEPLLNVLASDPSNVATILELASSPRAPASRASPPSWQPKLLDGLVAQGRIEEARAVWLRITGRPLGQAIFNPGFDETGAPPPFNWTLAQSGGALAEPDQDRLHVVHFGAKDMVVAAQTVLLAAGRYQLSMSVSGQAGKPGQLQWRVRCLPTGEQILGLGIDPPAKPARLAGEFVVPARGCGGQRLELVGQSQEFPGDADVLIGELNLSRLAS